MKKIKNKLFILVAVLTLVVSMSGVVAFAAEKDSAGNQFAAEENMAINSDKDYYWAGSILKAEDVNIGYDAIMAGQNLDITLGEIGGNVRAAGEIISLNDVKIGRNVTVAGQTIVLNSGTSMDAAYIAGQNIEFAGKANSLNIYGETVVINGTVKGDVKVYGDKVTLGDDAKVTGKLIVTAGSNPEISPTAIVGDMDISIANNSSTGATAAAVLAGAMIIWKVISVFATIIVGVLFCLILKRPTYAAGQMLKKRPVAVPLTGFISVFVVPMVCLFLCFTVIGIPIAALLFVAYVMILILSTAFAGVSLGQLVFPKWNRWGSGMLGVVIVAVACAIPYIGWVASMAAGAFSLGYFILLAFYEMKGKNKNKNMQEH